MLPTKVWWGWSKASQELKAEKDVFGLDLFLQRGISMIRNRPGLVEILKTVLHIGAVRYGGPQVWR